MAPPTLSRAGQRKLDGATGGWLPCLTHGRRRATEPPGHSDKAVRTERYKLIHWVNRDGVDELYDLAHDPYELANVIGDPRYAGIAHELRADLARLVAEAVGL
jgi:arylsulfatase A-like enzyme